MQLISKKMEDTLRLMVREHGFEAIFNSLKMIVESEYERAKRDYEFLQSMIVRPVEEEKPAAEEEKPAAEEEKPVAEEEQPADPTIKTVEIVGKEQIPAAVKPRKFFKKASKA